MSLANILMKMYVVPPFEQIIKHTQGVLGAMSKNSVK